jgi:REP element-mobilizing transposase RayT
MARANRHFIPGHAWHLTHRCHKREFLLKFKKDKQRWIYWLFQAKKRFGLCILNFTITSNHIHLLIFDTGNGSDVVPKSIQLIAGQTGQEFNSRKGRKGAFWEDRYHATAVAADNHLIRCMVYIDMNMVRAGVVKHPKEWPFSGYWYLQSFPQRYRLIDIDKVMKLVNLRDRDQFFETYRNWIDAAVKQGKRKRERQWTESIAVGPRQYVEKVKEHMGYKAIGRKVIETKDSFVLRERNASYPDITEKSDKLPQDDNRLYWYDALDDGMD